MYFKVLVHNSILESSLFYQGITRKIHFYVRDKQTMNNIHDL